ncbi:unnamed protein product [Sphenostylis stenocarpa]|uniref:LysM domain-containing protein n=1 Tax=Sphenostylis stenocarpa TaxID=92480 RepID=A0AA86S594_9FABA|nr:unnamed protein product [Sphenostylis stenocarpa]
MYEYDENLPNSQMMMMSSLAAASPPTLPYIQHPVSKLDTLAGIAIKYGVEVADIRKVNGLVTDRQMFALNTLHIPLNGKHPPPITTGFRHDNTEHSPADNECCELFESFQPLRWKSSERKHSPVMRSLQSPYGAKPKMKKSSSEIFMVEYEKRSLKCSENGPSYRNSPLSSKSSCHQKSYSLATDIMERSDSMTGIEARKKEPDKRHGTLIRRNHKSEANLQRIPELLLKYDSSSNGGFSTRSANGLAQRQKSSSRLALTPYSKQEVLFITSVSRRINQLKLD